VEVTVNNAGSECVSCDGATLSLAGPGFRTVRDGSLKRLCPGDQKIVTIGVEGSTNGSVPVDVIINSAVGRQSSLFEGIEIGLSKWTSESSSLARHESPEWFNDAKYGIFIHWGPYAVTGWGNSSPYESYAEWFWYV
jgi:hypothetical protein